MTAEVKKLLKLVFSKKLLGLLILAAQLAIVAATADMLYTGRIFILGGTTVLSIVVILFEINRDVSPSFKIIWIAIIAVVPFFGALLYLYVHFDVLSFGIKKRAHIFNEVTRQRISANSGALGKLCESEPQEADIFNYLFKNANAPCYSNSGADYFEIGEKMYKRLLNDVKSAKKYIFLEYFIVNENDRMWQELHAVLKDKAKEGVDVRIIYDGMGSLTCTSSDFADDIRKNKIKCRIFSPVKPFLSTYHNNRDHRKIAVIDGECAYTGGINLADEYINRKCRFGHWKDSAVRISGDAVEGFVHMFLQMWVFLDRNEEKFEKYFSKGQTGGISGGCIAPFEDNPLDNEYVTENVFLHMINNAKNYIYISTPYLILDDELTNALRFAAKRGVDVRITMPHIPDKWYAFALARTYYPELLISGVKIYEYTPGFSHAKSTVSDGKRAYIGSANYDFRSLYLHYECGAYIYKSPVIDEMYSDYMNTLAKCREFKLSDYKTLSIFYRLIGRIFRLFAPLM